MGQILTIMRHKIQERGGKLREDPLAADVLDGGPPHEQAVELADAVEAAMAGLKPRHVEICRLFYDEELSCQEIAARLGCSRWTARRVLDGFGARLEEHLGR